MVLLLFIPLSIFLSACGAQFSAIDTRVPTTANPLEAEKFAIDLDQPASEDMQAVVSMCNSEELEGFTMYKKKEFVCSLLPGAIRMSKQVYKQRLQLKVLDRKSQSSPLSTDEKEWLRRIQIDYGLKSSSTIEDVLKRVDIVPLPLILTQAAIESGWGTSRAALQGKNLFGIHGAFGKDSCLTAQNNKNVCIKKYKSVLEGVSDYIEFLNTKNSSEAFRQKRFHFRQSGVPLDPLQLADTLNLYSIRGAEYTNHLQRMMIEQNFIRFSFTENNN